MIILKNNLEKRPEFYAQTFLDKLIIKKFIQNIPTLSNHLLYPYSH